MAVSAGEFGNYTGNTTSDNSLAMFLDSGVSEHCFDSAPGLRGLVDYKILKEPHKIAIKQANTSWKEMLQASSPVLSSATMDRSSP